MQKMIEYRPECSDLVDNRLSAYQLNYHHLRYFWAVARDGKLTRTARALRVSPSALSAQIRQLEDELEVRLFDREGRGLVLTEQGRLVLSFADEIFGAGESLVATLAEGRHHSEVLRIGAVATLSRNFQDSFVQPLLTRDDVFLRLQSGRLDDLLERLARHELDVVLSNRAAPHQPGAPWRSASIARQAVSIVGRPRQGGFEFPSDVGQDPMILPTADNEVRTSFDALCERLGLRVRVRAEVDDMATMRLMARDTPALALLPSVVVRDELRTGVLVEHCVVPGLFETFYAITVARHFEHPLLGGLLSRGEAEFLAMGG